jgi:hypothetical protein
MELLLAFPGNGKPQPCPYVFCLNGKCSTVLNKTLCIFIAKIAPKIAFKKTLLHGPLQLQNH